MDTKQRILAFLRYTGEKTYIFEQKCGLANGYISKIKGNIGVQKLEGIARAYPELNKDWLITGEGEMLNPSVHVTQGDHATAIGNGSGNTNHYNSDAVIEILHEQLRVKDKQIEGLIQALQK